MPSANNYRKTIASMVLLTSSSISTPFADADTLLLKFDAYLVNGSCDFSLDKSRLNLGTTLSSELRGATLVNPQPFELEIKNCTVTGASNPIVKVSGEGQRLDKWVFRNSSSTAENIGVMLVNGSSPPTYASNAVAADDSFALSEKGGSIEDQKLSFWAGLTCGDASQCSSAKGGMVMANITFTLDFL